mmetsp:Transcript_24013/g.49112  ORF Transcript_24013/g.49112 Transcript_24013/m.49112 type:complete len:112 (+) Transcript_24013:348-683(+)
MMILPLLHWIVPRCGSVHRHRNAGEESKRKKRHVEIIRSKRVSKRTYQGILFVLFLPQVPAGTCCDGNQDKLQGNTSTVVTVIQNTIDKHTVIFVDFANVLITGWWRLISM